jgi:hypothetical protein
MDFSKLNDKQYIRDYFDVEIPKSFIIFLEQANGFSIRNSVDIDFFLFEMFEILRIEGYSARYQQTPPEFFPFASNGNGGEHFGFIIHTIEEKDYPAGYLYQYSVGKRNICD